MMQALLDASVHLGHRGSFWNPKMAPYIFMKRDNIHIIDLRKTEQLLEQARDFVREMASDERTLLFVGTKRQAQEVVAQEATRCGSYYINNCWLGGMLTNFATVHRSLDRLRKLQTILTDGTHTRFPKKEVVLMEKERVRLEKVFGGIKEMRQIPDAIFIIDVVRERTSVLEANRLGIPVIAITDTNANPDEITYVIPGNDDATRSIRLITSRIADAVLEGRQLKESRRMKAATPTIEPGPVTVTESVRDTAIPQI